MKSINSILRELSFDNLHEWAGAKIFNRGKGYVNQVSALQERLRTMAQKQRRYDLVAA